MATACLLAALCSAASAQDMNRYVTTLADIPDFLGIDFQDALAALAADFGLSFESISTINLPGGLTLDVSMMPQELARLVSELTGVAIIEEDRQVASIPVGPLTGAGTTNTSALSSEFTPYGIGLVGALSVSDDAVSNRKVCIIDSGYALGHPDLPSDVTGTDLFAGAWQEDGTGHGTHVAGKFTVQLH